MWKERTFSSNSSIDDDEVEQKPKYVKNDTRKNILKRINNIQNECESIYKEIMAESPTTPKMYQEPQSQSQNYHPYFQYYPKGFFYFSFLNISFNIILNYY